MVNIYARHEGVVVWTNDQCDEGSTEKLFRRAGELILIFQSIHDRQFHRVSVPSFDIRYPAENGFFILDSITENFEDLKKMALEQTMLRKVAQMKLLKRHSLSGESEEATALNVEIQELQHSIDALAPLVGGYLKTASRRAGFSQPLPVRRGQLVCRMKKFETMFDRTQTRIWYEPFGLLPPSNLSDYLKWGKEETKIAQLKGWVKVTNVTEQEALRWIVQTVVVHAYILTGRNLLNVDWWGKSDPFLRLSIGDQAVTSEKVFSNNDSPDFYEHFVFTVLIPGAAKLKIAVMDKGDMLAADSTIGEAIIDLEERQLISKDKEMFLPPLQAFPLEYVTLQKSREDDDFGVSCGTLRCMVDLVVDGAPYEPLVVNDLGSTHAFELRVVIWDVADISVFKGASGERNDLKVRMELFLTGIDLQDTYEVYYTDVHLFAKTTATYNWRIVKKVNLPVAALSLKFALIDNNAVYDDDTLYAPESLSLDALTHTTVTKIRTDEALLDPLDYTIGFDEPMGQGMVEMWCQSYWCAPFEAMGCPTAVTSCCNRRDMDDDFFGSPPQPAPFSSWLKLVCCGRTGYLRRERMTTHSPAHLHCTVALIPQDVAEAHPAGQGRSAPDALPEPTDRPSPNLMFTDPVAYLNLVVGQQTCALIKASTACFCGVLFLVIIAFVVAVIVIAARMP
nr:hypothetical protein TgIa.0180 [Toxoplasma gondii RH]